MAGILSGDVEILIHKTAPSRGPDDARYRTLAQAYLDFKPASRRRLQEGGVVENVGMNADSQLQEELLQSTQEERESKASYRPEDDEEETLASETSFEYSFTNRFGAGAVRAIESPILSFNSAIDNADSPVFRWPANRKDEGSEIIGRQSQIPNSAGSWNTPRSVIADSQPEVNRALTVFSSPTRVLELYLQKLQSSGEKSSGETRSIELERRGSSERLSSTRSIQTSSSPHAGTPSSPSPIKSLRGEPQRIYQQFTHPAVPPSTQDPDIGLKRKWPESSSDDTHISSSAPTKLAMASSLPSLPLPPQFSQPSKWQRTEPVSTGEENKSDPVSSNKTTEAATSSPTNTAISSTWSQSIEIRPRPPKTSSGDLTAEMLITDTLRQLAKKMSLSFFFRPHLQTRELRPMERGYWLVNCESWKEGLRGRCWNCFGNYIGKDLLGWGVWCVRDENYGTLRVYCWGIIVGHIYLLLYVASEGKIKGKGACWIGGDGQRIIEMPS
jgi:hypothetical protein